MDDSLFCMFNNVLPMHLLKIQRSGGNLLRSTLTNYASKEIYKISARKGKEMSGVNLYIVPYKKLLHQPLNNSRQLSILEDPSKFLRSCAVCKYRYYRSSMSFNAENQV